VRSADQSESVASSEDLSRFILRIRETLLRDPDSWENCDLSSFLEAMAAWLHDMPGYYENMGKPFSGEASWALFADLLAAARVYE
jgi:hypothetical protein